MYFNWKASPFILIGATLSWFFLSLLLQAPFGHTLMCASSIKECFYTDDYLFSSKLVRVFPFSEVQDISTEVSSRGKRTLYNLKIQLRDSLIVMNGFDMGNWVAYAAKQLRAYIKAPQSDMFQTQTNYGFPVKLLLGLCTAVGILLAVLPFRKPKDFNKTNT